MLIVEESLESTTLHTSLSQIKASEATWQASYQHTTQQLTACETSHANLTAQLTASTDNTSSAASQNRQLEQEVSVLAQESQALATALTVLQAQEAKGQTHMQVLSDQNEQQASRLAAKDIQLRDLLATYRKVCMEKATAMEAHQV